jgi:hypothetical protein
MILGLALASLPSMAGSILQTTNPPVAVALKQQTPQLEVSVIANKAKYKRRDRIRLDVKLTNTDGVKDIFVYGLLEFGHGGSFTLYRRDAKGREVPTRFIDEGLSAPPKADDKNAFVKLRPDHFLGTSYRSSIYLLHLEKPGRYSIWLEYHCPILKADVDVSPFWGAENGLIKSNVLTIEVRP